MGDYKVGYGRPPAETRFQPGHSGNPKGRPGRKRSELGDIVQDVLETPTRYRENGRNRTATRYQVALMKLFERAIKGDVDAADLLLRKRAFASRTADAGAANVIIEDWLPDHPGETADKKARSAGHGESGEHDQ